MKEVIAIASPGRWYDPGVLFRLTPCLIALAFGCAQPPAAGPEPRPEVAQPPVRWVQRTLAELAVHEPVLVPVFGSSERVVERSYAEGIDDLRLAAIVAEREDGWLHLRRGSVGWWRDIGEDETPTQARYRVRLHDPELALSEELVFLHFHPSRPALQQLVPLYLSMQRVAGMDLDRFWRLMARDRSHLFRVPPSLEDYRADALFRRACRRAGLPPVRSQVVTVLGTYTYRSDPALESALLEDAPRSREIWDQAIRGARTLEELLEKMRWAGFFTEFEPVPGEAWEGLRLWFVRELHAAEERRGE